MSVLPSPPILTSRIQVFSDFNCPYCFTLNEWLHGLELGSRIRWVGVEHRPDLPADGTNQAEDIQQLKLEVDDVRRRAPENGVREPPLWCNSRKALLLQNAVEVDLPDEAPALRRRLFRRYWHEGVLLVDEATSALGLRRFSEMNLDDEESELDRLTSWWRAHVDRIPCMIAPTGVVHLGLQDRARVERFMQSAIAETTPGPGCR